jgi:hypothetical protein
LSLPERRDTLGLLARVSWDGCRLPERRDALAVPPNPETLGLSSRAGVPRRLVGRAPWSRLAGNPNWQRPPHSMEIGTLRAQRLVNGGIGGSTVERDRTRSQPRPGRQGEHVNPVDFPRAQCRPANLRVTGQRICVGEPTCRPGRRSAEKPSRAVPRQYSALTHGERSKGLPRNITRFITAARASRVGVACQRVGSSRLIGRAYHPHRIHVLDATSMSRFH